MDNELFELCKQVYENTAWKTNQYINKYTGRIKIEGIDLFTGDDTPLYTSDYLLEKLPKYIANEMLELTQRQSEIRNGWLVGYCDEDGYFGEAQAVGKNMLQALLKLTLALKEAGEL